MIRRLGEKDISAYYVYFERSITLNSARKRGVHFGAALRPGAMRNLSAATSDKVESLRRSLLQEVAHHFEGFRDAGEIIERRYSDTGKRPISVYARNNRHEYFAESFVAYFVVPEVLVKHDPNGSRMVEEVLRASQKT